MSKTEKKILQQMKSNEGLFSFEMVNGVGIRTVNALYRLEQKGLVEITLDDVKTSQALDRRGNWFGNCRGSYSSASRIVRAKLVHSPRESLC